MAIGGVWIPVTLLASSAQTLRHAMQRELIGALGAVGAAQVRFLRGDVARGPHGLERT